MAGSVATSWKRLGEARSVTSLVATPGRQAARVLGLLCVAMGALVLSTGWLLTPSEVRHGELAAAGVGAVLLGAALALLPLERVRERNLLWPVAATLVWMGFVNHAVTGALGPYRHIYVLIFAFVGLTQRRGTSLLLLPLAVVTYLLPELGNEDRSLAIVGVAVAVPVWVLAAEVLALGTDRLKAVNRQLEARNAEVERYADFQRDFVATASHELRTPITSISGYVELLQDDEALTPEQREHLGVIARNTGRLSSLVQDLLTINKGEAGHLEPHVVPTKVEELISPALEAFSGACRAKEVRLGVDVPSGLPRVCIDHGQMEQVIGNLMSNAVKFTPPGGAVDVVCREREGFVDVAIVDTGVGIPIGEMDRVFDRFFRSSTSIEMAVPGTGLGLAIAKSMVESQGGRISVNGNAGQGTTFTLSLPTEGA
ncbi:MAG TPA: HAMP domain-containing sensor histidine kinase [Actinomycetota bacterium]|nr:HAMP domain-containing sensor histidine kinase [Actinomycetota bacterium]